MAVKTKFKAGMGFAVITILLDSIGIGLIMPIMPDLIADLGITDLSTGALYGGALATAYAAMQFIFMPIFGNLSDRYGRRPVLLAAIAALFVDYILMGLAQSFVVLFIGRIIAGIAGATISTASAYIADVSAPEDRAKNFGMVGAAFGIGFILGPAIGGIVGEFGVRLPFFLAAAFSILNFLFGLYFLPESLPMEKRRAFIWRRANPFGALKRAVSLKELRPLMIVIFCIMLSGTVYGSVWSFFGKEKFDWSPFVIGMTFASFGIGLVIVQGWLIRLILPALGEIKTVRLGISLVSIGMLGIVLATETWMIFALLPLLVLGEISGPTINGMLSKRVGDDEQGELQGVLTSVQSVTALIGPLIYTGLFKLFSDDIGPYFPGAPFLLSAGFVLLALVLFLRQRD